MPEIADTAEMAPGTLYLYFPSKEALYFELVIEGYDILNDRLQDGISPTAPPRAQAESYVNALVAFAKERPECFDMIFSLVRRERRGAEEALDPDVAQRLEEREDRCKGVLAGIVRPAWDEGMERELQPTVDAVWSMLMGAIFRFGRDGQAVFKDVAAAARRIILRGVFGDE
jgi:AcrR family transcriptional regulator